MGKASMKRARKRGFTEAQEYTFGDNIYNYLACGDGFITLNIQQNFSNYILQIHAIKVFYRLDTDNGSSGIFIY